MNVVRDCPAARWLPSRHHFALTRLIALLRARGATPGAAVLHVDHIVLAIEPDQTTIEHYAVSLWLTLTIAWYIAVALPLPMAIATIPALVFAPMAAQLPLYFIGGVAVPLWNAFTKARIENNQRLNSVALMTLMAIASSYAASMSSPVRYAAWFFFIVVALNAAASVVLSLLRGRIRELERRCGL